MKGKATKAKQIPDTPEAPLWFRKLSEGTPFGKRKDKLMLRILRLGGKHLLEPLCEMSFSRDAEMPKREPTTKMLLSALAEMKATREEWEKSKARLAMLRANSTKYTKKRRILINANNCFCSMEVWTRKANAPKVTK